MSGGVRVPIISSFDPKGIEAATRRLDRFGREVRNGFGRITSAAKTATLAIAGIGGAAITGAFKAVQAASDIGEATSKVDVVFGDAAAAVIAFSKTADKSLGLSRQSVLDAAGTFGTFGKAAGLTGDDLSDFTIDFTTLAADLASFNNTTPEEAIQALGAGLRGESEPLRRYGILLDDATLRAEAFALGIGDGKRPLTAQEKILAAQASIFKQSADAQGDFARTSDGLANKTRILRAQFANIVVQIGEKFLPIALKIADFISEKVIPAIEKLSATFSESGFNGLLKSLVSWITNTGLPTLRNKLSEWGGALVDWIRPRIRPAIDKITEWLKAFADWMTTDGYRLIVAKADEWGTALVAWIKPRIGFALEELGELIKQLGDWILQTGLPRFTGYVTDLYRVLSQKLIDVTPSVIAAMAQLIFNVGRWALTDGRKEMEKLAAKVAIAFVNAWWDTTTYFFASAAGPAKRLANAIIGVFNRYVIPLLNTVLDNLTVGGINIGRFFNVPSLPTFDVGSADTTRAFAGPKLADGGIVKSPTLAMIGEAGPEAVVPLDQYGRGGNTYITVQGALDPVGVATQIRRLLNDDARRSGRVVLV